MNQSSDKLALELEELKDENELLLIQLRQVQEELEHYYLLYTIEGKRPTRVIKEERRAREEAEKARDEILASTSWRLTAPWRWARLRLTGRKIDAIEPSPTEFATFEEERRARLKAEEQVVALLGSTSWKITAPIRWRPLRSRKSLQKAERLR
jgi:hypothetical protein